jgi:hypothetical protein
MEPGKGDSSGTISPFWIDLRALFCKIRWRNEREIPFPMKFPTKSLLFMFLVLLCTGIPLRAQTGGLQIFNPHWSIVIDDFGYSDLAFDQRPGFEGREYLSGEWAAAISYVANAVQKGPTWLNREFLFPDWSTGSDFQFQTTVQKLAGTNAYGFDVIQSVITNAHLRITIRSEMIDTTNGIPQGVSPRSSTTGASKLSDRYVLHQTFTISNKTGQALSNLKFFKFLHALEASTALYDDRNYGPAYKGHHYTVTQESVDPTPTPGEIVNHDRVAMHLNIAPTAWEVGAYGVEGIDDHAFGKPSVGVHFSVEADSLSNLDSFIPPTKWVSGAMRCNLGTLASFASTNIEVLMSLQTVTTVQSPFNIGKVSGMVGWGDNSFGQAKGPSQFTDVQALAAGANHSLLLRNDGSIVAWGRNASGQTNVPAGLINMRAIAAGSNHSLALGSGGNIVAWGSNLFGQTNVPAGLSHVLSIAAGDNHNLALKPESTVVAWGDNSRGQTNVPAGLVNVMAIAAGGNHNLALLYDGTVVAWGDNRRGQTSVPSIVNLTGASAIAAGESHSVALLFDGSVVAWGDNSLGQTAVPSDLMYPMAIAAGGNHTLALNYDGSVVAWGANGHGESQVPSTLADATSIAAGGNHSLAIASSTSRPTLGIAKSGGSIVLSVAAPTSQTAATTPAVLEEKSPLTAANWNELTGTAILEDGRYKVVVPAGAGPRFYRLKLTSP